jgi:hypothetical protein
MSWLFAFALAALLLPSRPAIALSLAAGQLIMGLNFFFLEKLVKLFTQAGATSKGSRRTPLPGRFFGIAALKLSLVYGGAFALIRTQSVLPASRFPCSRSFSNRSSWPSARGLRLGRGEQPQPRLSPEMPSSLPRSCS